MQLLEIAAIQAAAQQVGRNLVCTLRIKLVPRRKLKLSIGSSQRSPETSMEKVAGLDHDHAGNAAVRIADNAALRNSGRSTRRGAPGQFSPSYDRCHTASSLRASVLNSLAAASIGALTSGASTMPSHWRFAASL